MSSFYDSGKKGSETSFRQTWDDKEYAKKGAARNKKKNDDTSEGGQKRKGREEVDPTKKRYKQHEYQPELDAGLAPLQARQEKLELDAKVGQTELVQHASRQPGYHCEVCDLSYRDNISYLDHLNSRRHQRRLGMNLLTERATLEDVLAMFDKLRAKKAQGPKVVDVTTHMDTVREEEEQARKDKLAQKKLRKKEKQAKSELIEEDADAVEMASMGFTSFGGSKKAS